MVTGYMNTTNKYDPIAPKRPWPVIRSKPIVQRLHFRQLMSIPHNGICLSIIITKNRKWKFLSVGLKLLFSPASIARKAVTLPWSCVPVCLALMNYNYDYYNIIAQHTHALDLKIYLVHTVSFIAAPRTVLLSHGKPASAATSRESWVAHLSEK